MKQILLGWQGREFLFLPPRIKFIYEFFSPHICIYKRAKHYSRLVTKQNKHLIEEVKRRFGSCEEVAIIYVSMEDVIAKWFSDTLEYYPPVEDDK